MPGRICAHCGSADTQAGADRVQCLHCGLHTDFTGRAIPPPPAVAEEVGWQPHLQDDTAREVEATQAEVRK